jgi:hypothetical protein
MSGGDQINRIAMLRTIEAAKELDNQLGNRKGCGPVLEIMRRLRARAAESLEALAFVNAYDVEKVKVLQNEVKKYDEFVEWLRDISAEGLSYDQQITAEEREDMIDILVQTPQGQREAVAMGLINLNHDDG